MKKKLIAATLLLTLTTFVACNAASTIKLVESYINTLLPYVEAAANIIIAAESPESADLAQQVEAAVNSGVKEIQTLLDNVTNANAQTTRQQVVAIADSLKNQLDGLLAVGHIKNPAAQMKVKAFVIAADSLIDQLANIIPATQTTALSAKQQAKVSALCSNYKHQYNAILDTKTGDAAVDYALGKQKRFRHWYFKAY